MEHYQTETGTTTALEKHSAVQDAIMTALVEQKDAVEATRKPAQLIMIQTPATNGLYQLLVQETLTALTAVQEAESAALQTGLQTLAEQTIATNHTTTAVQDTLAKTTNAFHQLAALTTALTEQQGAAGQ